MSLGGIVLPGGRGDGNPRLRERTIAVKPRAGPRARGKRGGGRYKFWILDFGFWIGRWLHAGLGRFMAESKRNAEAAEAAERSAEADWV